MHCLHHQNHTDLDLLRHLHHSTYINSNTSQAVHIPKCLNSDLLDHSNNASKYVIIEDRLLETLRMKLQDARKCGIKGHYLTVTVSTYEEMLKRVQFKPLSLQ